MSRVRVATANPSSQQSNTSLITARADSSVQIFGVYVSSDTVETITLRNSVGHENLWQQYVAANGGSVVVSYPIKMAESRYGEGVDYNTSATSNVWLTVLYKYSTE